ncbi:hypothetical protein HUO09_16955 [Vibrio sp. Y2-5]|uniref:hypothetical protein n=1 Tax=Vibrio sp. Y2-5 TaxID=2743977 RepID=UPI0016609F00|nr:hypothetical protein [Vibrio sp. Y2-5]MBD0788045.1 hypothetical protein [Vibrio sp. Y2-5]
MNPRKLQFIQNKLTSLEMMSKLVSKEIESASKTLAQALCGGMGMVLDVQQFDKVKEHIRELELDFIESHEKTISDLTIQHNRIKTAISRIKNGEYLTCVDCRSDIPSKILNVDKTSTRCGCCIEKNHHLQVKLGINQLTESNRSIELHQLS